MSCIYAHSTVYCQPTGLAIPETSCYYAIMAKKDKTFDNILRVTEQFMSGRSFSAFSEREIAERLQLEKQHRPTLKKVLDDLVKRGVARRSRGKYLTEESLDELVTGTIQMHPRGFGFVQPDSTDIYTQDIFIPRHNTQNAVQGDHVEVMVSSKSTSDKGPEGRVVSILKRGRTHLAGIVRKAERAGDILVYVPILGAEQRVVLQPSKKDRVKVGDRIIMEVIDWGARDTETVCQLTQFIGHISDPSFDVIAAAEEYDLRSEFPEEVLKEARQFPKQVTQEAIQEREDLRDLVAITIDPDTAKDFDDALSLTKNRKGYLLGVHIADVSQYVTPDSALDKEAAERSNSTYFPGECLPMLPEGLSNELCSLKPNVNRLTVSILVDLDLKGGVRKYRIVRSVIRSRKRFTYKEAKRVLDGKKRSPHSELLQLMVKLCGLLKKQRYERGSIEFAIPDLEVKVDEKGAPLTAEYVAYDITHQLVEEFMLKANELVATDLSKQGKGIPYRVHEEPSADNIRDFSLLANAFGFKLSQAPSPKELQLFFDEALQTPFGQYLAISYIRCMQLAIYSPENVGHYGLGLLHYCHFTSPIRRYVDLVIHRTLFEKHISQDELEAVALRCSEQERLSAKAENQVRLLKKLRLLKRYSEEDPQRAYEAVITRVRNFGVTFELTDFMLEGFIHISELGNDYYVYSEKTMKMSGRHTGKSFFAGDKITVMLKDLDLILLETEWHLVL